MARKNKKQRKHPKFWLGFKMVLLLFLLTILVGGIIFYFKYGKDIFAMQDDAVALVKESSIDTFRSSETSIVYNNKGKEIAKLKGEKDSYYLTLDKIPKAVKDAAIVTEDKKFYSHNGIDAKGIMRAVLALIKNNGEKTQGASTITQQLARGVFLSTEKTYERKIKEIFIALELEKKYTKSQILEFYLNTIYYANGYYGIEAAARGYFGKSCQELSLGQLCFLCSIPNNPTLYNPLKNFDNTVKRKNRILDQMLDDGVITKVDYDEAYQEEIKLNIQEVQKRDYIQTFVSYCAIRELMKKNGFEFKNSFADKEERETYETEYDDAYSTAQQMLLNKGYKIYATAGTAAFLNAHGVGTEAVYWPDERPDAENNVMKMIAEHKFDLIVNIPKNHTKRELTNGYRIRRGAIDHNIPLITNARLASAFIEAFCELKLEDIAIKNWQEYK